MNQHTKTTVGRALRERLMRLTATALIVSLLASHFSPFTFHFSLLTLHLSLSPPAYAASSWAPTLLVNREAFQVIDDSDAAGNPTLRFGEGLAKSITYNRSTGRFEFNVGLQTSGDVSGSGSLTIEGSLSGATIGGFGLLSCNGTTQKLLWNSTSKKFECGTDLNIAWSNTGSLQGQFDARYVKKAGDTMTGTLTINSRGAYTGAILLRVLGVLSGAYLHAEKGLSSSGTILAVGNLTTKGTASGKNLTFMGAAASYILGSLGVGKTSPATQLEVAGTISGRLVTQNGGGNNYFMGNVGVGTANPLVLVHLSKSDNTTGNNVGSSLMVQNTDTTNSNGALIGFRSTDGGGTSLTTAQVGAEFTSHATNAQSADIVFKTINAGSTIGEKMRLTSSGNLGINTTAPRAKLEVQGSMSGARLYAASAFSGAGLVDCSNATSSKLLWNSSTQQFSCGTDQTGAGGGLTYPQAEGMFLNQGGDTMTGTLTINSRGAYSGAVLLKILGVLSGAYLHAEKGLSSSGTILAVGNLTTKGTASGKNLTFMGAASSYILGSFGLGTTSPETKLEVVGTISGSALKTTGNVNVSGSLLTQLKTGGGVLYSNTGTLAATAKGSSGQLLVAQGTAAPAFKSPTGAMVWYLDGTLVVGTGQGAAVTMPFGMTATSINLRANAAPTGQAIVVDIKKDNQTIFSTKPWIYKGYKYGGTGAALSITNLTGGTVVTVDVTQVGSTFAGSGLTIQINGIRKY